ncbi:STAS domain-containing protein [Methylocaldum sp.]|uniref:STAS domain-containing protein n=1 Tax=Methylocaldum sp. TaxID=1969727 RepID=UPI002D22838B|nr:STAS domain-containing protein [Methylocaldum sp.]HYE36103.1 STAS domain-containing protein [Methylocaldum sp.]
MAKSPIPFELIDEGQGCYRLKGELTFATASAVLKKTLVIFKEASRLSFNLEGISRVDSAGVALLLEWLRRAEQARTELCYANLPQNVKAIARVSGIEQLIAAGSSEAVD